MKIKLFFLSLIFIIGTNTSFAAPEDVLQTKKSVLKIINIISDNNGKTLGVSTGTGFLINSDGYLLTNNHVINGERGLNSTLLVIDGDSTAEANRRPAKLIWTSTEKDIAIIQATGISNRPVVKLEETMPLIGRDIFAIGYPGVTSAHRLNAQNVEATITDGILSIIIDEGVAGIATAVLQHNVPVNPGNSGGPLVNACGAVIGINTQAIDKNGGRDIQGVFYASHIKASIEALKSNNIGFELNSASCSTEVTGNNNKIWLSVLALVISLITITLSLRKPRENIIHSIESYTQYIRRSGNKPVDIPSPSNSPTPAPVTPPTNSKTWHLSGLVKSTNEKLDLDLTENELRQGVIIGRNQQLCDYSIPDTKLSRKHVRLSYQEKGILVEDLNSGNGTYIDNHRVKPRTPQLLSRGGCLNLSNAITFTLN